MLLNEDKRRKDKREDNIIILRGTETSSRTTLIPFRWPLSSASPIQFLNPPHSLPSGLLPSPTLRRFASTPAPAAGEARWWRRVLAPAPRASSLPSRSLPLSSPSPFSLPFEWAISWTEIGARRWQKLKLQRNLMNMTTAMMKVKMTVKNLPCKKNLPFHMLVTDPKGKLKFHCVYKYVFLCRMIMLQ